METQSTERFATSTNETAIGVSKLEKSYGDVKAVSDVSFSVQRGEVFGLLGPNGAGKTTTISCVCGLRRPDRGSVEVDGVDVEKHPQRAQSRLGVVPQELALYEELTVEENLQVFGALFPHMSGKKLYAAAERCLDFVDLTKHRDRRVSELSGGMKRRLNIASALMHDPPVVLADEPTVGVDPQSRNHIFERVEELARQGKAVVYTTHYMEEVERLCNRIAIVDHGRVVAEGTLEELLAHVTKTQTLRVQLSKGQAVKVSTLEGEGHQDFEGFEDLDMEGRGRVSAELEERFSPLRCGFEGSLLELSFKGPPPITDLVFWFAERKLSVTRMETDRPTLEDAFLELTGRSLRDG